MTPDTLATVGRALHGPQWQSALARDLGVNIRTMQRWVAGQHAIPASLRDDLLRVLRARSAELIDLIATIENRKEPR